MYSNRVLFIYILLFSIFQNLFAQTPINNCSDTFDGIQESCIRSNIENFKNDPIIIEEKITDNVYFYQTPNGGLGKMKIISIVNDKNMTRDDLARGLTECTVYIQSATYFNNKAFSPDTTFSIRQDYGVWTEDGIAFEKFGNDNIVLKRKVAPNKEDDRCILDPIGMKLALYKKMSDRNVDTSKGKYLFYMASFLIALAVFLVARSTLEEENKFKASETMDEAEADKKTLPTSDFVLKYSRPFFKRYLTPIVQNMKGRQNLKNKYKKKLANAGLTKELNSEDFFAFKLFLILGFPILFILIRIFLDETWPLSMIPLLSVVGYYYPDFWINGKIEKRKEEVLFGLPFVVDMLALSVEAGLDFMAAMQKVIERAPKSAIIEEFETLIKDTRLGSSRADGLRQMAFRVDVVQVNSFCATLIAADSVGASIGPILKQLSAEMRQKRASDAEKKGATAATKILFPMIFFIMPAVFFAIASPMIFEFMSGGGNK
jgi:tight adherence protein C